MGAGVQQKEITLIKLMIREMGKAFILLLQGAITREKVSLLVRKRSMDKILK